MSNEKRLVLCILLIFGWVTIAPSLFRSLGLLPHVPVKKAPAQAAADALRPPRRPTKIWPRPNLRITLRTRRPRKLRPPQAAKKADDKTAQAAGDKPAGPRLARGLQGARSRLVQRQDALRLPPGGAARSEGGRGRVDLFVTLRCRVRGTRQPSTYRCKSFTATCSRRRPWP